MAWEKQVEAWVQALDEARRAVRLVDLNGELKDLDGAVAYAVQRAGVIRRLASGGHVAGEAGGPVAGVVGYKIGWADSEARRRQGVPEPIFGRFLPEDLVAEGGIVSRAELIRPAVEGEFVLVVERELAGAGVTPDEARAACRLTLGFDLFDSRLAGGAGTWAAAVADDCGAARVVVVPGGVAVPGPGGLAEVELVLRRNGEQVASGTGAKLDPDPAATVAWLARKLGTEGESLRPGQFVLLGAAAGPVPMGGGESWEVRAAGLGAGRVEVAGGKG